MVQVGDIKISDIFYKIQKFLRTEWAPIITTNGIKFLMAGHFQNKPYCLKTFFLGLERLQYLNRFYFHIKIQTNQIFLF